MLKIKIQFHGWLAACSAGNALAPANGLLALELEVDPEDTVRQVLADLAKHQPVLDQCVVSASGDYHGETLLVLNGQLLELAGGLDSVFTAGDVLELVPAYTGG